MTSPVIRTLPRETICSANHGGVIEHVSREMVVWWYERPHRHLNEKPDGSFSTIIRADVVFRYLDENDIPHGYVRFPIGISRLGTFRKGTIWKNGTCINEIDRGPEEEFTVDFTEKSWSFSTFGDRTLPFSTRDYELHFNRSDAKLLNFPIIGEEDKNLLIPCLEFLARGYGASAEIKRVLTTYDWDGVQERLYGCIDPDPVRWTVTPANFIPDQDALILAHMLYSPYSRITARNIYNQFDQALANGRMPAGLEVKPWFEGIAQVACRGIWTNGGKTFLCTELTGMSRPRFQSYVLAKGVYAEKDLETGKPIVTPVPDDPEDQPKTPIYVTDDEEPEANARPKVIGDPGFRMLGEDCPHEVTKVNLTYSKKTQVPVDHGDKERNSTGDGKGENGVGRVVPQAEMIIGNGGIVNELWFALTDLKNRKGISELGWYHEKSGFRNDREYQFHTLPGLDEGGPSGVKSWLSFKNTSGRRGILIARFKMSDKPYYLFELQRKRKAKKGVSYEEKISGLIITLPGDKPAQAEISYICSQVRLQMGKFRKIPDIQRYTPHFYRHYMAGETFLAARTLRLALNALTKR